MTSSSTSEPFLSKRIKRAIPSVLSTQTQSPNPHSSLPAMYEYNDPLALLRHMPPETAISWPLVFPSEPPPQLHPFVPATNLTAANEFDSVIEALVTVKSEAGNNSCCCSSYGSPSSLPSYYSQRPSYIQRSMSSHSLPKDEEHFNPNFLSPEILDPETSPMRKVFSTGDIQRINSVHQHSRQPESPLSHENYAIEGSNKACRYSAEEKKERIERYRSKRNHRNFTKKIKYACRKTLADSRPRIRGRFARNEELIEISQIKWRQMGVDDDEEDDDVWINFLDSFSENLVR